MWSAMEEYTNGGVAVALETSLYVGDMAGRPGDPGDSDLGFARAVGSARGGTLEFQTPEAAFGPAAAGAGGPLTGAAPGAPTGSSPSAPPRALLARAALHGGYARGPLMLILVGAQGAGKSFFSAALASAGGGAWAIACQDTTGNREKVERIAAQALRSGRSVVVDRTHLDAAQRAHFLRVARDCDARAHALYFRRPLPLLLARVAGRVGHPGGVEGEEKAPVVRFAFGKLSPPDYAEGFELISTASSDVSAATWCDAYARVGHATAHPPATAAAAPDAAPGDGVAAPIGRLALGTMKLGKRGMSALRGSGFEWVDTAPTYKNEAHLLSQGLLGDGVKVIVKVPRRASDGKGAAEAATAVRAELSDSLAKLGRARAELLMLHWPIGDATTMRAVWGAMEEAVHAGRATALGVSNFGARALAELLGSCSVAPVVLQVERHPLLPQWDLLDFCSRRGIAMQAQPATSDPAQPPPPTRIATYGHGFPRTTTGAHAARGREGRGMPPRPPDRRPRGGGERHERRAGARAVECAPRRRRRRQVQQRGTRRRASRRGADPRAEAIIRGADGGARYDLAAGRGARDAIPRRGPQSAVDARVAVAASAATVVSCGARYRE